VSLCSAIGVELVLCVAMQCYWSGAGSVCSYAVLLEWSWFCVSLCSAIGVELVLCVAMQCYWSGAGSVCCYAVLLEWSWFCVVLCSVIGVELVLCVAMQCYWRGVGSVSCYWRWRVSFEAQIRRATHPPCWPMKLVLLSQYCERDIIVAMVNHG
jgi:hypothetical protein